MYIVTYKENITQIGDDTDGTVEYKERIVSTKEEALAVKAMLAKDKTVSDIKIIMEI